MSTIRIPDHWTPEEALLVSSFLFDLDRAIWDRHGDRMALLCGYKPPEEPFDPPAPVDPPSPAPPLDDDTGGFWDDEIPF